MSNFSDTMAVSVQPEYQLNKDVKYFAIEKELISNFFNNNGACASSCGGETSKSDDDYDLEDIYNVCNDLYRQELLVALGMTELPEMICFDDMMRNDFDVYWKNINVVCERLYADVTIPSFKNMIDRVAKEYSQIHYCDEDSERGNEGGEGKEQEKQKEDENRDVLYYQLFSYHTFHLIHRLLQIQYRDLPPLLELQLINEQQCQTLVAERIQVLCDLEKTFLHMMHCD